MAEEEGARKDEEKEVDGLDEPGCCPPLSFHPTNATDSSYLFRPHGGDNSVGPQRTSIGDGESVSSFEGLFIAARCHREGDGAKR